MSTYIVKYFSCRHQHIFFMSMTWQPYLEDNRVELLSVEKVIFLESSGARIGMCVPSIDPATWGNPNLVWNLVDNRIELLSIKLIFPWILGCLDWNVCPVNGSWQLGEIQIRSRMFAHHPAKITISQNTILCHQSREFWFIPHLLFRCSPSIATCNKAWNASYALVQFWIGLPI